MSKVKMPEQRYWRDADGDLNPRGYTPDEMEAYAAARVAEAMEASGWQPIATAPRDGTEFQTWLGFWEPRCRFKPDTETLEIWGRADYDMDDWVTVPHLTATHWRPLPEPPNTHPA